MAKPKTSYVCQSCGAVTAKWAGKCAECGAWNTIQEEVAEAKPAGGLRPVWTPVHRPEPLADVRGVDVSRTRTNIQELDQVLGGGVVKGSVVLIGGEPGIGKSTIMLQVAGILAAVSRSVLYVSGEESPAQVKMRADRLKSRTEGVDFLASNALEDVLSACSEKRYDYLVIDSIQTLVTAELSSAGGTVGQVKQVTYRLVELAKSTGTTVFIVGQVTKDGAIAGPKVLEHLVDTVLYFEGDYSRGVRILRSVKNRFGSTNEVGIFEMGEAGLSEVGSAAFIPKDSEAAAGKVLCPVVEGTRAFLVEIQALAATTFFQFPRRVATGVDLNRLQMLIAILDKKGGLNLNGADVYLNVAGGLKINETASDLAVCAAMVGSFREKGIPLDTAFIGELGLTGEIRPVGNMAARLAECARFGIKRVFVPKGTVTDTKITLVPVPHITAMLDTL